MILQQCVQLQLSHLLCVRPAMSLQLMWSSDMHLASRGRLTGT